MCDDREPPDDRNVKGESESSAWKYGHFVCIYHFWRKKGSIGALVRRGGEELSFARI
jgi:hypothetical protein